MKVKDDNGVEREVVSRKEAKEQGLDRYFTGKPCKKYGHVSERYVGSWHCVECMRVYGQSDEKKEYMKQYYKDNIEQIKQYRQDNVEQIKEYNKQYYKDNAEHKRDRAKQYQQENKEYRNEYRRNRYTTDESYKTSVICRSMLQRTLIATNSTKDSRTYELLGYCNDELKENISSKFLSSMTWENYGEWHIDHVYPVSRYIAEGVTDPSIINALDNLIPMWSDHNMEKKAQSLVEYLDSNLDLCDTYGHFIEQED